MVALTMLRYLTDHMRSLHVSVAQRLVKHHDFVASLAAVLDLKPWNKRETTILETKVRGRSLTASRPVWSDLGHRCCESSPG